MKWLTGEQINQFLEKNDYDIEKKTTLKGSPRWIDQKCTPDVLAIIADCILEYCNSNPSKEEFSSLDIWHNEYTVNNVESIFKKPNPNEKKARNEYDKFFQQPMELFAYAGILEKRKNGNRNLYKLLNEDVLEYISIREMNALNFLNLYNTKVLKDSGIYNYFNTFLEEQTPDTYKVLKEKFSSYMINNTNINKPLECNRIFTKVLNPIAFMNNALGTERGYISKNKITKDMLMYNRNNFRDILLSKPKGMTRTQFYDTLPDKPNINLIKYQSAKAKKLLRLYNDTFNEGKSEVNDELAIGQAIHMHHIFPENEFNEISGYIENIIALTPTQHYCKAHPNGNTKVVDKAFQQICLLAKADHIENNIKNEEEIIYSFSNFIYVLTVGLDDNRFNEIEYMDFIEVVRIINMDYVSA